MLVLVDEQGWTAEFSEGAFMSVKRVGMLTGGGDCPGLNAVIRGIVRKGIVSYDYEMVGVLEGWRGMLEGLSRPLDLNADSGILPRGGTILGSSRTNPYQDDTDGGAVVMIHWVWPIASLSKASMWWVCPRPLIMIWMVRIRHLALIPLLTL